MIERILPAEVVAVSTREDDLSVVLCPEEEAAIAAAVEGRRREFATARACARGAYERLGVPAAPVVPGAHGEPSWADGVVGSITHCDGYRACALARASEILTLGIDAEPDAPLPGKLLEVVAGPEERSCLDEATRVRPGVNWDRLLFSAKEAVYKAWFPLGGRRLGFEHAVVSFDATGDAFSARVLAPGPAGRLVLAGRWVAADGLLATAVAVPVG